jgi:nitrate reductase NapE component
VESDSGTSKGASRNLLIFALFFAAIFALHARLLHLPYFWDEAGYYIPAAHDLLLTGTLIPHSTPSNAHPPLVMVYLALCWKIFGFSLLVTRTAMLAMAAFALLGVFRLARRIANLQIATASVICTALYPVFFVQSSLAQVDLPAAGFVMWGLLAYVEEQFTGIAIWFSLAALTKETAILVPAGLFAWEVAREFSGYKQSVDSRAKKLAAICIPVFPLLCWYAYHHAKTGFIFGNPEFFRYNVQATMHPLRMLLALGMRLWQLFGYLGLWLLTLAGVAAMLRPAVRDGERERPRIELLMQFAFLTIAVIYVIAMAIVGGAVLARYMLPIVPLVIMIFVSTLWRRVRFWKPVIGVVALMFIIALFVNPPYGFTFEDNLAYRDYILLHEDAEHFLEAHDPHGLTLTAWPGNDEITRPYLGYVQRPLQAVRIDDFTVEQVMSAADSQTPFDAAFVFSTKYQPERPLLEHWRWWQETKIRFFDYHRDLPPALAARILGGTIVWQEERNGQWAAVIEIQQTHDAMNLGLR